MYDAVFIIKINQTLQHRFSDFTNNVDVNGALMPVDVVQRSTNVASARVLRVIHANIPSIHEFHDNSYMNVDGKASIISNDVWRITVVHDL